VLALVNQNGYLKRDPLSDWQPVKIPQNVCRYNDIIYRRLAKHRDITSGGIDNQYTSHQTQFTYFVHTFVINGLKWAELHAYPFAEMETLRVVNSSFIK